MTTKRTALCLLLIGVLFFNTTVIAIPYARGDEVQRLKDEIVQRNSRLTEIEKEIAQHKADLTKVGAEKKTLQGAITTLEIERKKIGADISYTQNKIGTTDLEISKLNFDITQSEDDISKNRNAIMEVIRSIDENDNQTMVEALLEHANLSELWGEITELEHIRGVLGDEVKKLVSLKILLEQKKGDQEGKRRSLLGLKEEYSDQKEVLENNKSEKDRLLKETKNKEANYQALLVAKQKAKETIIKELRDFESKLQFILDPSTIPAPGTRVFDWPLANVTITQYFGGTEFAKRNPGIYAGRAYHPGIDLGTPVGTKIFAPLDGVVRATGNTDAVSGCYSWGKWTLIDHSNGLSTLYAHQSQIAVVPGQSVGRGEVIGYSGNSGYSTGPHLHFTVYAKAGVTVRKFSDIKTVTSCGAATTPVAAADAYLDPIQYLPPV